MRLLCPDTAESSIRFGSFLAMRVMAVCLKSCMRTSLKSARSLARLKLVSKAGKLTGITLPSMLLGSVWRVAIALEESGTVLDSPFLVNSMNAVFLLKSMSIHFSPNNSPLRIAVSNARITKGLV